MRDDLPEGFRDEIHSHVQVALCWRDRLKLLCGWRFHLTVKTLCENEPGRVQGRSTLSIERPDWWPRRKRSIVAWEVQSDA